jgi:hypothetical protein
LVGWIKLYPFFLIGFVLNGLLPLAGLNPSGEWADGKKGMRACPLNNVGVRAYTYIV